MDHEDVADFHRKFGLEYQGPPRFLDPELTKFRLKFLKEELKEFEDAVTAGDMVKAFDALIDLNYVSHGTAYLMGLPWAAGWAAVQRANMRKVRAASLEDSAAKTGRGHASDVVKPPGWIAPDTELTVLLSGAGWFPHEVGIDPAAPGADRTVYYETGHNCLAYLPLEITNGDFRNCYKCQAKWNYLAGQWVRDASAAGYYAGLAR